MRLNWRQLTTWLLLFWLCTSSNTLCPSYCTCKLTDKGKRKVSCFTGGMTEIPISEMDPGTEILDIEPLDNNWNILTITPIFQHFKFLDEIRIRRSNIQQIGMHAFWGVPSIRLLDFVFNNITSVSDHNFRGLVNLIELKLDDNKIVSLQSGVFKHLTELRILSLQRNFLEELVPRLFLKLGKLHMLRLSGNKFEELDPEAFKDIPELRVLECRSCGLRRINTQIYHLLPYLSQLDLGNNQIQFIASDEFRDLHKLHSLKIDGNQLPVVLEHTFVNQQQLKYLCLARNRIAKITDTAFLNLSSLVELDIGFNKLDKLEAFAVDHVSGTLQKLRASGNYFNLSVIKTILQSLYKVWDVELAKLNLKHVPVGLLPDRIRTLNLSWNNISEISVEALPKHLVDLDLSSNRIKGIDEKVVLKLETMKNVVLDSNPWSCDLCHLTAVVLRVNRTHLFKNLTCASPKFLKGVEFRSLRIEDISSCNKNAVNEEDNSVSLDKTKLTLITGVSCLLVFLAFCIIFVVCSCMKRRARNAIELQKRERERDNVSVTNPVAVFCKGEISFKFPLDLTERKVTVCTIDEIKRGDSQLRNLPNGTGI